MGRIIVKPLASTRQETFSIIRWAPNIGVSVGWGMMETIRVLIVFMVKATWLLPY